MPRNTKCEAMYDKYGTHLYEWGPISKFKMGWKCHNCGHHLPTNVEYTIGSRWSLCWSCKQRFQMTDEIADTAMSGDHSPKCYDCTRDTSQLDTIIEHMSKQSVKTRPCMKCGKPVVYDPENWIIRSFCDDCVQNKVQEDKPETYNPIEEHAPDCETYVGGECTCR